MSTMWDQGGQGPKVGEWVVTIDGHVDKSENDSSEDCSYYAIELPIELHEIPEVVGASGETGRGSVDDKSTS